MEVHTHTQQPARRDLDNVCVFSDWWFGSIKG